MSGTFDAEVAMLELEQGSRARSLLAEMVAQPAARPVQAELLRLAYAGCEAPDRMTPRAVQDVCRALIVLYWQMGISAEHPSAGPDPAS